MELYSDSEETQGKNVYKAINFLRHVLLYTRKCVESIFTQYGAQITDQDTIRKFYGQIGRNEHDSSLYKRNDNRLVEMARQGIPTLHDQNRKGRR